MTTSAAPIPSKDDILTICAISLLAAIIADVLHEGVGHAALALLLGAQSGVLSTVAWSSTFESRLVAAGGTLVNLVAGVIFFLLLRRAQNVSAGMRYFLLLCMAFNLFDGTGYFFFSGVTNFGDWARVIANSHPHWFWRMTLVVAGIAAYYGAIVLLGTEFVRDFGIAAKDSRLSRLSVIPYFSAVVLIAFSGLFNPFGIKLVFLSALPATAGAYCGLLWFRYYMPEKIVPARAPESIVRNYSWISMSAILALPFIAILGPGITLTLRN